MLAHGILSTTFDKGIDINRKLNLFRYLAAQAMLSFLIHTLHAFTEQFMFIFKVLLLSDILLI